MKHYSKQTAGYTDTVTVGTSRIKRLVKVLAGILCGVLLFNSAPMFGATIPPTYSLNLGWNPSSSPGVVGGHLHYGTVSGDYTNTIVVGNVATITVPGLSSGVTYYFAVTAITTNGIESIYSNEISYPPVVPGRLLNITALTGRQFMLTMTGPTGHTNNIEASSNLTTWTVIGKVTLGTGGSASFTDTNAASFSKRFYRTSDSQP